MRSETCVPENRARRSTAAVTGYVCVHFFQKIPDEGCPKQTHEMQRDIGKCKATPNQGLFIDYGCARMYMYFKTNPVDGYFSGYLTSSTGLVEYS